MVPDIHHHHIQPKATVRSNGFVHRAVEKDDKWLEIGAFTARAQANSVLVALGGHRHEPIYTQVHPHTLEGVLDSRSDAGLPGSEMTVQDDELAGGAHRSRARAARARAR